jgi:hypothetical protein
MNPMQRSGADDDSDRDAYNAAFHELGLRWHWDSATYDRLLHASPDAGERVRVYLQTTQPHLLKAYDADFLVSAIEARARQRRGQPAAAGRNFNWASLQSADIGA